MQDQTLFTFAAPEIAEFLHNNNVDLVELLIREGVDVRQGQESDPAQPGTKDAAMVILASAAVIGALQPVLKRLLEGLLYRPIRVTEVIPMEVSSNEGDGTASKIVWVDRTSIIENLPPQEKSKLSVSLLGFKFDFETDVVVR